MPYEQALRRDRRPVSASALRTFAARGPTYSLYYPCRMLGIAGTFLYSVLSGRAFSVSWEHPVPFDLIFDSPNVDWSQRFRPGSTHPRSIYTNETLAGQRTKIPLHNMNAAGLDRIFPSFVEDHQAEPWVVVRRFNLSLSSYKPHIPHA